MPVISKIEMFKLIRDARKENLQNKIVMDSRVGPDDLIEDFTCSIDEFQKERD